MSVADKITRLTTARDNIRMALGEKGVSAETHGFEDFATDIGSISSGDQPQLNAPTISASGNTNGQTLIAISNPSTNGNFVKKYKIFLDGVYLSETMQTSGIAITAEGSHAVTVKACGTDFADSPPSNSVAANNYTITATVVNCIASSSNPTTISNNGATVTLQFTPAAGLEVRSSSFVITGASVVSVDKLTGSITIGSATGNVTMTVTALEELSAAVLTVDGLGSESPVSVTFTEEGSEFDWDFAEVTVDGNVFIKIPTMYRKINTVVDGQITSFSLSNKKNDNDYYPYPCFLDTDGTTILPYVLIGKYCSSSTSVMNSVNANYATQTLQQGRTNARTLGNGYQLYDWQMQKLFTDLAMFHKKTVDFNYGQNIPEYLGIAHLQNNVWVDGFYHNSDKWYAALNPANYVSSPSTNPPTGYDEASFACPTTSWNCISKLGYDARNQFFNEPTEVNGTNLRAYYCDGFNYSSGIRPVYSSVGFSIAFYGLWHCNASDSWSAGYGVRLCYKPLTA